MGAPIDLPEGSVRVTYKSFTTYNRPTQPCPLCLGFNLMCAHTPDVGYQVRCIENHAAQIGVATSYCPTLESSVKMWDKGFELTQKARAENCRRTKRIRL